MPEFTHDCSIGSYAANGMVGTTQLVQEVVLIKELLTSMKLQIGTRLVRLHSLLLFMTFK